MIGKTDDFKNQRQWVQQVCIPVNAKLHTESSPARSVVEGKLPVRWSFLTRISSGTTQFFEQLSSSLIRPHRPDGSQMRFFDVLHVIKEPMETMLQSKAIDMTMILYHPGTDIGKQEVSNGALR